MQALSQASIINNSKCMSEIVNKCKIYLMADDPKDV